MAAFAPERVVSKAGAKLTHRAAAVGSAMSSAVDSSEHSGCPCDPRKVLALVDGEWNRKLLQLCPRQTEAAAVPLRPGHELCVRTDSSVQCPPQQERQSASQCGLLQETYKQPPVRPFRT